MGWGVKCIGCVMMSLHFWSSAISISAPTCMKLIEGVLVTEFKLILLMSLSCRVNMCFVRFSRRRA